VHALNSIFGYYQNVKRYFSQELAHYSFFNKEISMTHRVFNKNEKGQGLVEYALIMVLVAVVSIVVLATMGPGISNVYCEMVTTLGGTCDSGDDEQQVADEGGDDQSLILDNSIPDDEEEEEEEGDNRPNPFSTGEPNWDENDNPSCEEGLYHPIGCYGCPDGFTPAVEDAQVVCNPNG